MRFSCGTISSTIIIHIQSQNNNLNMVFLTREKDENPVIIRNRQQNKFGKRRGRRVFGDELTRAKILE